LMAVRLVIWPNARLKPVARQVQLSLGGRNLTQAYFNQPPMAASCPLDNVLMPRVSAQGAHRNARLN
jgi:hypothetical protein